MKHHNHKVITTLGDLMLGNIEKLLAKKFILVSVLLFQLAFNSSIGQIKWRSIGPSGGDVSSLKTFPAKPNTLICGLLNGGLYLSKNRGESWKNILTNPVYDISITDDSIAYAATANGFWISRNWGNNWEQILDHKTNHVFSHKNGIVVIDTANNQNVYSHELLISKDFGRVFRKWNGTISNSSESVNFLQSGKVIRTSGSRIYKSDDDSWNSWQDLGQIPQDQYSDKSNPILIQSEDENSIFVYGQYVDMHPVGFIMPGIYKSTDLGITWTNLSSVSVSYAVIKNNLIFAGSEKGVLYKVDVLNGSSKSLFTFGGKITGILAEKWDDNELIVSTKGGIFKTTDGGNNWINLDNGIDHAFVTGLQLLKRNHLSERIVASVLHSGIWISDNGGLNWQLKDKFEVIPGLLKKCSGNQEYLYAGGNNFYMSSNSGENWNTINNIPNLSYYGWYSSAIDIAIDDNYHNKFYFIYSDHSLDHYRGNFYIRNTLTDNIWKIFSEPTSRTNLFFDNEKKYLWSSSSNLTAEDSAGTLKHSIQLPDGTKPDFFIVVKDNIIFYDVNKNKIFYSIDLGNTWKNSDYSFKPYHLSYSGTRIMRIAGNLKYSEKQNRLFLLLPENGLLVSEDMGATWKTFNNGISSNIIFQMDFSYISPTVTYIATSDGLYVCDITTNIENEKQILPDNFSLSQNYPNPFNPITTIKYSIPEASFPSPEGNGRGVLVTLKVYDLLGREIATLVNETKSPGSYESTFKGASLPSGVYFYTMQAGSFTETKKFVLMK